MTTNSRRQSYKIYNRVRSIDSFSGYVKKMVYLFPKNNNVKSQGAKK